jgi:hypothetical protein
LHGRVREEGAVDAPLPAAVDGDRRPLGTTHIGESVAHRARSPGMSLNIAAGDIGPGRQVSRAVAPGNARTKGNGPECHREASVGARRPGLEHAERDGRITITKLSQVAAALDCTLLYALVPNTSLMQTVERQATQVMDRQLGYVIATMTLEDQAVTTRQQDPIRADQIQAAVGRGDLWRTR